MMLPPTYTSKEKKRKKRKPIHQSGQAALARLFKKILPPHSGDKSKRYSRGNIILKTELGLDNDREAKRWPAYLYETFCEVQQQML